MTDALRVLLVEDSEADAKLVVHEIQRGRDPISTERVEDAAAMRAALTTKKWDLVISDWSMPKFSALEALELLKSTALDVPFIIVSGTIGEESAVEAMRAGARDYVLKDKLARLAPAIERELREYAERAEHRRERNTTGESLRVSEEALRRSEEQLRQSQKMEAIGILAGGVAHDFNNILTVILSFSEMAMLELKPQDPMRADLHEIKLAGERALSLTRQLLAFSRQQIIDPKVLDLNQIIRDVEKLLRRLVREDVEFVTLPAAGLGMCRSDIGQIEQVVMNLVVNARDAMPHGGKLTLETANVELDLDYAHMHLGVKPGRYVMLAVSDTGIGMDKATQARIFEPFFTTKEKGQGTGLGLSTVFGIVEQSGGSIWVYSEPGKGTTFKIYFPRTEELPEAIEAPRAVTTLRGSETILLVEDEEQIRNVARGILHRHGYDVIEARSPGEALLSCERHKGTIHLLLTDVVMPQMSGPQLAERIGPLRPEMKVLFMSGYADGAVAGLFATGTAFIQKPLTPGSLTRKVREVLDRPRPA